MWFWFALLAVSLWSASNLIDKNVISNYFKNPLWTTVISSLVGLIAALLVFVFVGFVVPSNYFLFLALVRAVFWIAGTVLYFHGLMQGEVSRLMPIYLLVPVFVALIAVFSLGEILLPIQYFGIILAVMGGILISINLKDKSKSWKGVSYSVMASFLYALTYVLEKAMLSMQDYWATFAWSSMLMFVVATSVLLFYWKKMLAAVKKYRKATVYSFLSEGIGTLGSLFMLIATSLTFVSLSSAVTAIQPLIVLALVAVVHFFKPEILKEELSKATFLQKLVAILLMIAGVMMFT